ncbi:MAG TPA: DUF2203 domain-containing protein [Holophagaceae bacterium]|nr:DUF2203 domain-containing protein [Holophagaceae bacterium]
MARTFTLEEARSRMPQVRAMTEPVFRLAESLAQEIQEADAAKDEARAEALQERLQDLVQSWSDAMRDLGADVKGLWLVDFDSGDGYWCWAWPEESLDHWHSYEAGFRGRMPVTEKPDHAHH